MLQDALMFENEDWTVTDAGLEHKRNGYFIERDVIGDRRSDGLWTWPAHMAEKTWCCPDGFAEAFGHALQAYDLTGQAEVCVDEPEARWFERGLEASRGGMDVAAEARVRGRAFAGTRSSPRHQPARIRAAADAAHGQRASRG